MLSVVIDAHDIQITVVVEVTSREAHGSAGCREQMLLECSTRFVDVDRQHAIAPECNGKVYPTVPIKIGRNHLFGIRVGGGVETYWSLERPVAISISDAQNSCSSHRQVQMTISI